MRTTPSRGGSSSPLRSSGRRADSPSRLTRVLALISAIALAIIANLVLIPATGASAADGALDPTSFKPGGIPAQGSCGVGGYGTYVKFTTGGGDTAVKTATTTAGKTYTATYSTDAASQTFQILSLRDDAGSLLYFSGAVGGSSSLNPEWTFAPTGAPSPLLAVTNDANFSQFALCVYENETFTVKKVVTGTTTTQAFDVHVVCTLGGSTTVDTTVSLKDGQTSAPIIVAKGSSCTATDAVAGYTTTSTGPLGPIVTNPGGTITVTNARDKTGLTITKVQDAAPVAQRVWTFAVTCTDPRGFEPDYTATTSVTGSGTATLAGIPVGFGCSVTESGADLALFTSTPGVTQSVAAGGSVTFTNTRKTTDLTISKVQQGGDAQDWHFTVTCGPNAAGDTFTGSATVTGSGSATLTGIPTGLSCSVKEAEANVSPFDTTVSVTGGVVAAGGALTFTNTKRAHVTLTKTQNGVAPTYVYTFTLTGGPDAVTKTVQTTPGSTAPLDFGLVKPGSYTVCEQAVAAGTTPVVLAGGITLTLTDATLGTYCGAVTLTAGQDLALAIDNHVGEGGRRTIGYWKNWSTCSGTAGQLANAAKTGKKLLDDVLPITLGSYVVRDCKTGVAVLTNSSTKYAENGLAAQLLAAQANVSVAGAPQSVLNAIAQANALLTKIGYQGSPSSIIGANSPDRAEAVRLATLLDQFNNGLLG